MISSNEIEAAAFAIYQDFANRKHGANPDDIRYRWNKLPDIIQNGYRSEAKAALEAAAMES